MIVKSKIKCPGVTRRETKDGYRKYRKFQNVPGRNSKIGFQYQAVIPKAVKPIQCIELQFISERHIWDPRELPVKKSNFVCQG